MLNFLGKSSQLTGGRPRRNELLRQMGKPHRRARKPTAKRTEVVEPLSPMLRPTRVVEAPFAVLPERGARPSRSFRSLRPGWTITIDYRARAPIRG